MELISALVLLTVGLSTASPYGYGTKGGAAAKADASAVAGAFTGIGELPLSIPSGPGFSGSGSFSKSYSSSSASSSASSSSFSYSGSGVNGGTHGCRAGNCETEGGSLDGSPAAGSQTYSNANAGALASQHESKPHTGSYGQKHNDNSSQNNKSQKCGPQGCPELNASSNGEDNSQSNSNAKAEVANFNSQDCSGADCNNLSEGKSKCSSGQCEPTNKCSTGDCGSVSNANTPTSQYGSDKKCTSSECKPYKDNEGRPNDYGNNDIQVKKYESSNPKSSYGSECSNGHCDGSSSSPGSYSNTPSYNKPVTHLTAPKLDNTCSGPNCHSGQTYTPTDENNSLCNGGNCVKSQTNIPFSSTIPQNVNSDGGPYQSKPNYSHNSSPPPSSFIPLGCSPSTPGCGPTPGTTPNDCTSGNCGPYSPVLGYSGSPSANQIPASLINPSGQACSPGTPGCQLISSGLPGCISGNCDKHPSSYSSSDFPNTRPSYSHSILPSSTQGKLFPPSCVPGTPGCDIPKLNGFSQCTSGNCRSAPGYGSGSNTEPNYSHANSPSHTPENPLSIGCSPGNPSCITNPSAPAYGDTPSLPSNGRGSTSSYFVNPLGPPCAPGTPSCGVSPPYTGPSGCSSGNCGAYPSVPGYTGSSSNPSFSSPSTKPACNPGTPGCAALPSSNSQPDCESGNCASYSPLSLKPNYTYNTLPPYPQVKPQESGCLPGTLGCSNPQSKCKAGNCNTFPTAHGCTPGTLGCSVSSGGPGNNPLNYGAASGGSSSNPASFGLHATGSYNKPYTGSFGIPSTSNAGSGITSPSQPSNVGAAAENSQHGAKEKLPYTGGFGGPPGILKPNEFKAPNSGYVSKPAINEPINTNQPCPSGVCKPTTPSAPSHTYGGLVSGAQASAAATANANAIAYTGGFGGPPGFLKPYDNGKIELNPTAASKHLGSLNGPQGASDIHSPHSNGGPQASASAVAQANAAAISGAGVSANKNINSDSGSYNHRHEGTGGCDGGCGGSGGNNYGYTGSGSYSKTGVIDNSGSGLALAGAAAKSVSSSSSGARSYGGSYASSSASAHATSGASVKGGYGRR